MPNPSTSFSDRLMALLFLGQARWLEWQALAMQTALMEWTRYRRDLAILAQDGVDPTSPLMDFSDIAAAWCRWLVQEQLAAAQGLLNQCALPYLGLSRAGRRTGFDPGRRRSAVVIDFPDRRRPDPTR